MSHSGHGSGSSDIPKDPELAKVYWIFAGGVIAVATLLNVKERLLCRQRLSAASKSEIDPARPKNVVLRSWATITAISRELSYAAPPVILPKWPQANFPSLGSVLLIAANLCLLLCLAFYKFDLDNKRTWEAVAVRCAWMTITQLPLVFLMAGKRNIIGFLTGSSYERLNWIHRWIARCMFITATVHMSYFFKSWDRFDYIDEKLETDIISRRGLGAWCVLLWITVSSFAPIRNLRYEIFVVQHVISYIGFIAIVMLHIPKKDHVWIWVPIGIYTFDRIVRTTYLLVNNLSIFSKKKKDNSNSSLLACKATFEALPDRATKITVVDPPFSWSPGQHAFLSCHSIVPLQSHPFTITSLPSDGHLSFIIRAHKGGTHRLFRHANTQLPPLGPKSVIIDGPYGRVRPLEQFDTVVLIAGSTGGTFTIPLFRDLVRRQKLEKEGAGRGIVTRKIRFIWVVKNRRQIGWFAKELKEVFDVLAEMGQEDKVRLEVEASIYITCDDTLTADYNGGDGGNEKGSGNDKVGRSRDGGAATSNEKSAEAVPNTTTITTTTTTEATEAGEGDSSDKPYLCGGNRCCCTETVEDEDTISPLDRSSKTQTTCTCGMAPPAPTTTFSPSSSSSSSSSSPSLSSTNSTPAPTQRNSTTPLTQQPSNTPSILPPTITTLTGRPSTYKIINKELEKALGESAVVVCGPKGLVTMVRENVVKLSDERAVHKGTGAQGVYLHTEAFGW